MKKSVLIPALGALVVSLLAGCSGKDGKPLVRVGSKAFTEEFLIAELYSLVLEDAGYSVQRIFGIPSLHEGLVADELDLYPEYTGTGLLVYLQEAPLTDPQEVYDKVKEAYKTRFNLVWLESSRVNDSSCIVIKKSTADVLGISNLSDLRDRAPGLKLADFQGWSEREDNLIAMNRLYGEFKFKELVQIDAGLKYEMLAQDYVQVIPGLTTEPGVLDPRFVVVEEDIKVWPPYYLAPVVRQEALDKYPGIEAALNRVSASLDNPKIINLITRVDIRGEEYEDVAKDFFDANLK
jgi:osmoprotectant transport system substrate-binding protein